MERQHEDSSSFPMGETAQERGFSYVPESYIISTSHRSSQNLKTANIPVIDLSGLRGRNWEQQRNVVMDIRNACHRYGFFQIINHGIEQCVVDGAVSSASEFFKLPTKEKAKFMSNDVHNPVRYGTSLKDGVDKIQFWRLFLKHYAHPLQDWLPLWPLNPPDYREKMGKYTVEVQKLALEISGAITKSLGIGTAYVEEKMGEGMQVMAVNCYPPCPQPELVLGLPAHSDYSILTILLQNGLGLEILDSNDGAWKVIPEIKGALQVHVGDHLEVLSNGRYKSVVHRATLNKEKTRISIASLHSWGMDEKMEVAKELVDKEHPRGYKQSSFRDFLDFLAKTDIGEGKSFLETLKI